MTTLHKTIGDAVLIVEDDPLQMKLLQAMMKKLGIQSVGASSVSQATDLLHSADISMVLLDLQLGNEAGLDLLRELGTARQRQSVVLISGCDERTRTASTSIAHAHGVHVAAALGKPVRIEQLAHILCATPASVWRPRARQNVYPSPHELSAAISAGLIIPAFQPKVSLITGRTIGVEALSRWRSPLYGSVPPDVFVPLAESSAQIRALTELILTKSLEACARWRERFPEITVAVNVSPAVVDQAFLEKITSILATTGVPSSSLVVEITESGVIGDSLPVSDVLTRLRIAGVQLSIDDFGTGHSSLVSLMHMPFNELKLDRMFVANAAENPDAERILSSLIKLAREMGLRSVAEGVETEAVLQRLREYGCDAGQGWLWAPALSEHELFDWLHRQPGQVRNPGS